MPVVTTPIPGLLIFELITFEDNRGSFMESYNKRFFSENSINTEFVQDNQSSSLYGVIRGLHYQLEPYAQAKLIRVLSGKILDIVIDIRKGSPAYGESFSIELSKENKKQMFIPKGFAHGFIVLSEKAEVFYKCDQFYSKEHEAGIIYNDPVFNLDWRIPKDDRILSEKDKNLPLFKDAKNNFEYNL